MYIYFLFFGLCIFDNFSLAFLAFQRSLSPEPGQSRPDSRAQSPKGSRNKTKRSELKRSRGEKPKRTFVAVVVAVVVAVAVCVRVSFMWAICARVCVCVCECCFAFWAQVYQNSIFILCFNTICALLPCGSRRRRQQKVKSKKVKNKIKLHKIQVRNKRRATIKNKIKQKWKLIKNNKQSAFASAFCAFVWVRVCVSCLWQRIT